MSRMRSPHDENGSPIRRENTADASVELPKGRCRLRARIPSTPGAIAVRGHIRIARNSRSIAKFLDAENEAHGNASRDCALNQLAAAQIRHIQSVHRAKGAP